MSNVEVEFKYKLKMKRNYVRVTFSKVVIVHLTCTGEY